MSGQAGPLVMSSPLILKRTETENKWSLTPLFSEGAGTERSLLQDMSYNAGV